MSKAEVKKYIKSLDKSSLEELVLDLYSARKEAKDYLEYVIKPDKHVRQVARASCPTTFIFFCKESRITF